MVNEKNRLIWAAGMIDASGRVIASVEQGPTRTYAALSLVVVCNRFDAHARMMSAANNGERLQDDKAFLLSGYAAVRGFLAEVWPWLTNDTKREINAEIRKYKEMKAAALALRHKGLTRDN
jgi:hypothetical protein